MNWSEVVWMLISLWLMIIYPLILWLRKRKYGVANLRAWRAGTGFWWFGLLIRNSTSRIYGRQSPIPDESDEVIGWVLFAIIYLLSILACLLLRLGAKRNYAPTRT